MAVKDKQVFESRLANTSAYVYQSHFISKDDKRRVQWFEVRIYDNKTSRSFQKHEVHIPRDTNKKDLEAIKQSVIQYVTTTQTIYEKY